LLDGGRNAIECMFCWLMDHRWIANCYDKFAADFIGAVYLVATVIYSV
jgi:transposase